MRRLGIADVMAAYVALYNMDCRVKPGDDAWRDRAKDNHPVIPTALISTRMECILVFSSRLNSSCGPPLASR